MHNLIILLICVISTTQNTYHHSIEYSTDLVHDSTPLFHQFCNGIVLTDAEESSNPLGWIFNIGFNNTSPFFTDLAAHNQVTTLAVYSAFWTLGLASIILAASMILSEKLFFCCCKLPSKSTFKGKEKLAEGIVLLACLGVAIMGIVFAFKAESNGKIAKCQGYKSIDNWVLGTTNFTGFHQLTVDVCNISSQISDIINTEPALAALLAIVNENNAKISTAIDGIDATPDDSLKLINPNDVNGEPKAPAKYLSNLKPRTVENTITYTLDQEYKDQYSNIVTQSGAYSTYITGLKLGSFNNSLTTLITNILPMDLNYGDEYKTYNDHVDNVSFQIKMLSGIILGLMILTLIIHALTLIFPMKCIGIMHCGTITITLVASLLISSLAFMYSVNIYDTCHMLQQATSLTVENKQEKETVTKWVSSGIASSVSYSCLFGESSNISDPLFIGTGIADIYKASIDAIAQSKLYSVEFAKKDYSHQTATAIKNNLATYAANPINQYEPNAQEAINALNALTKSVKENCVVDDDWVFIEAQCTEGHPVVIPSGNALGAASCLILTAVSQEAFQARYHDFITKGCDTNDNIQHLYKQLYLYAENAVTVFNAITTSMDGYINNWGNEKQSLIKYSESVGKISITSSNESDAITTFIDPDKDNRTSCAGARLDMTNTMHRSCGWSSYMAMCCICELVVGFVAMFYVLLSGNYVRYMIFKGRKNNEDKFINFLPSEPIEKKTEDPKV